MEADPVSAFGGIVGLTQPVDMEMAQKLTEIFLEVIIAPSYEADALEALSKKPNLRVIELGGLGETCRGFDLKKVSGGFLVQDLDTGLVPPEEWKVVTARKPNDLEIKDLFLPGKW